MYCLRKILLPHWHAYVQRKTLEECKDPARVSIHDRNLKDIREAQQKEAQILAKEAERLAKAKRAEELRRKQVVREESHRKKHGVGKGLGGDGSDGDGDVDHVDIDEVRNRQQEKLKEKNAKQSTTQEQAAKKKESKPRSVPRTLAGTRAITNTTTTTATDDDSDDWDKVRNDKDDEFRESLAKDQAKEESKVLRLKRRQEALEKLDPEPTTKLEDTVLIAFKLPRKCKETRISRRFSKNSRINQLFYFLSSTGHLDKVREWRLISAVGAQQFPSDGEATLEELGLSPRGLVIVVDVDC
mmetsp:Transcript_26742/g.39603  ORF Transcript_26742/g.39603 Transcript_26742/m.39603 type:complete len:299 (-) Transcript_26742:589-1485(-)